MTINPLAAGFSQSPLWFHTKSPLAARIMAELEIHRVTTHRQKRQFLKFPWILYKGDPNWIPPLRSNQKELAGYVPHPFYERNSVQTFLATRGDQSLRADRGHTAFRQASRAKKI